MKVASAKEVMAYLTQVMRGEGEEISIKDRMKAAELLARKYTCVDEKEQKDYPVVIKDDVNE